ncbi:unnamed protein product [Oncorhynchus mykiss]|uniref:SEA domain-containing protein n=1 Tax=Oncorhynchus mykiss TaxID=8022 RepID=A0A060XBX0_ONCMY|nr:unnamed protein product [Oncorhynchus mykiss]
MPSVLAADDEGHYNESSRHAALPQDPAVPSNLSARVTPVEDGPRAPPAIPTDPTDPSGVTAESTREQPVQPSVLANASSLASSSAINSDNQTAGTTDPLSLAPVTNSTLNTSPEEGDSSLPANPDLPTVPVSSLATLGESDATLPDNVTSPFSTHTWNTTTPARADTNTTTPSTTAAHTNPTPDTVTNDSLQLTTVTTTTVTPLTVTTTTVTPQTTTASTTEAVTTTTWTTTTTQEVTTLQETTVMATTTDQTTTTTTTAPTTTTIAPTTTLTIPTTTKGTTPGPTTTEPTPTSPEGEHLPCNITEKTWVKTGTVWALNQQQLSLKTRSRHKQHVFSSQVERDLCSPHNVTLGYYVASGKTVYIASVVVETMNTYGFDKVLADIRQHSPLVKAVLVPVAPWASSLSVHLQLKTVLRFVGPEDNVNSCSFVQMMEQRLENAFEEAQDKVLESYSGLSVEIQSTAQVIGSPAVSLVYVVKNENAVLNGTVSSGLLNQLTAELVGYFLFFPPLIIAERKCPRASREGFA